MDTNNWRPTAPGGEPVMDMGDWRTQLQPDSRQRIVNKIMDTLKRHLPFSGEEGLQEPQKIAVGFEEKIYTAATNQSDYLRTISLKLSTMETKSQNTIPPGNGNKPLDPGAPLDSTAETGHASGADWQEEIYQKLQSMNVQGSIPTMQQNNMSSLQHGSLSSLSGVSTSQPNMMNTIQPGSNLDSGQGNALSSLHNKNLYHK